MAKGTQDHLRAGFSAFREGVETLMTIQGIKSHSELARLASKKGNGSPARKTVNNALAGRHDAQISTLEAIAAALDCPLWVLFLVGRQSKDLHSPSRERLIAMVRAYLKCDDEGRHHVESMAQAFAARAGK
jgi:hypothetical protein